jgi:uncharacterized membrane-anchored protein
MERLYYSIGWMRGPGIAHLGEVAEISVPAGCLFTDAKGAKAFIQTMESPKGGKALGVMQDSGNDSSECWYVVFREVRVGHVMDTDQDRLDPDAILASLRVVNAVANVERKEVDLPSTEIAGWERPPSYDPRTRNLTWVARVRLPKETRMEYASRILGRDGYVAADFLIHSRHPSTYIATFDSLMAGFHYDEGYGYGWFQQWHKTAPYGVSGLVAGSIPRPPGLLSRYLEVFAALFLTGAFFLNNLLRAKQRPADDRPAGNPPPTDAPDAS